MPYLTKSFFQLQFEAQDVMRKAFVLESRRLTAATASHCVFCSHSHLDQNLVKQVDRYLKSLGVDLYIDWEDSTMPRETSPRTAREIQRRITQCGRVLLVATKNSAKSVWVPWELGWSDAKLGPRNIAVLPISESEVSLDGIEFVGLYPVVKLSDVGVAGIWGPGQKNGIRLENWLSGEDNQWLGQIYDR